MQIETTGTAEDIISGAPAIAAYLGTHPCTIRRRARKGLIPGLYRIGNEYALSRKGYRDGITAAIAECSQRIA